MSTKVQKSDITVGTVLYREVPSRKKDGSVVRKVRVVVELWDGSEVRAELSKWDIYLGWNTSKDWDRAAWTEDGKPKIHRGTRAGLARWADGVMDV